jgi:hypothetical protein
MSAIEGIGALIGATYTSLSGPKENRKVGPYHRNRFGWIGRAFASVGLLDLKGIQKIHWDINYWTNEEVMAWRKSYISNCSSVTIAVSIELSLGVLII